MRRKESKACEKDADSMITAYFIHDGVCNTFNRVRGRTLYVKVRWPDEGGRFVNLVQLAWNRCEPVYMIYQVASGFPEVRATR